MRLSEHSKFNTKTNLIFIFVLFMSFTCGLQSSNAQKKVYTVVLDAGHGGKDPGNLGNGYKEKNIALKITLAIGNILKKNKDIKVVFTRKKDVFVALHNRAKKANKLNADMFISFHCDSHTSKAYGVSTFALGVSDRTNKRNFDIAKKENSVILLEKDYKQNYNYDPDFIYSLTYPTLQETTLDESLELAPLIQNRLVSKLKRHDRGVKQNDFLVLRNTTMPSVLIELGFLTNKKEGRYLNSKKGQQEMAKSIAKSIEEYVNQLKTNFLPANIDEKDIIEYKIQIASGKRKIATKSYNFKGLQGVERIKINSYYKYYYGKTTKYSSAKSMLKKVRQQGYKTSFIIAFKNGEKISVKEALEIEQSTKNY